jgi:2-phospho-L-lactate/phosphoenolpyruvate guanylyltransferase
MTLWAIVPVKPLRRGKSRLGGVLSEEERTVLNYSLLGQTLTLLSKVEEVDQTLVVSRDPAALALAREYGAKTIQEESAPQLNTALTRATILAHVYSTEGVLILPADLPLVQPEDIRQIIRLGQNPPVVVIAPDRRKDGTNTLLVNPAGMIHYAFGPNSFQKHCELAKKAGARLEIVENEAIGLDLDLPEDLDLIRQMQMVSINP